MSLAPEPPATTSTRTSCPYCGVGCGVLVRRGAGGAVLVSGDPAHPSNAGRLCSKGSALAETLGHEGRLLRPRIDGRDADWDEALETVARRFRDVIEEHGPDAVAFYVSGQLLTEDYYVANKLMKGFVGSANIDTNSRLCMSSAVAAHQRAFGEDVVPGCYEDLELADLLVLVGSNAAWCHPVLWRRVEAARRRRPGMRIVVIDPRRTATCEIADLHLAIRAGTDVTLFDGLLAHLAREGVVDAGFLSTRTAGADDALAAACTAAGSVEEVAAACGLDTSSVESFYCLFARTERVVTAWSQGVNQSTSGTDKATAILNCHLLTGRIGRPGMGPFSLTGQPNAMGGREVGGLANMLAAHLSLEEESHRTLVQEFWSSPVVASRPGLKAVELFEAVGDGRIKALWIMATNPAASLPDADRVREAIARCDFVVVSDCVDDTDTATLADVLLPASAWGEKDGTTTNSERRITRQRAFLAPPGDARPDWWIVSRVAGRMGRAEAFAYDSAHEIFVEHARLSALAAAAAARAFDLGGLAALAVDEYDALEPVQWPVRAGDALGTARLFGNGHFRHADSRARLEPTPPRAPAASPCERFPFVLNTGRIRDQWHTMTRTGRSARLAEHLPEPFVDVHDDDAAAAGLADGDLAQVRTPWGSSVLRVRTGGDVPRGTLFVPMHWTAASASDARIGAMVGPFVDPVSGEPEFKHTPAAIGRVAIAWHGVFASRRAPGRDVLESAPCWWSRVQGEGFARIELAGSNGAGDAGAWARGLLAVDSTPLEVVDSAAGVYRGAVVRGDVLESCVFVARDRQALPSRAWLASLFGSTAVTAADRLALLAGRPFVGAVDTSAVVCSCYGVRRETIRTAIEQQELTSASEIGACLRAGTNCGSCLPELRTLLATCSRARAA